MKDIPLVGYADKFSLEPDEKISFKVSSKSTKPYSAKLIKVISGDPNPEGPGLIEEDLEADFNGVHPSIKKDIQTGSHIEVDTKSSLNDLKSFTFGATIWPTLPKKHPQTIISNFDSSSNSGITIEIGPKGLRAQVGDGSKDELLLELNSPLSERRWYHVWVSFDETSRSLSIGQIPVFNDFDLDGVKLAEIIINRRPKFNPKHPLLIAAHKEDKAVNHFNGKIERPFILNFSANQKIILDIATGNSNSGVIAAWDFSQRIGDNKVNDLGPTNLIGKIVNLPTQAVKSSKWDGTEFDWRKKPAHYAAIHFHEDDLYDCAWDTDFSFTVPTNLRSGIYAAKLIDEQDNEEMIPFFVTAKQGKPQSRICVLIPSFTYTVYANIARGNTNKKMLERIKDWSASPWTTDNFPQFGLSTYNYHSDGSGISSSSRRRPILTMRSNVISYPGVPGSGCRHFPADSHLWYWLTTKGYEFDVITDDELHKYGLAAIEKYSVLVTCSHPEYHTPQSLHALQEYTNTGGHLMYLGGNGFYWKVAVSDAWPDAVEIRRGEGGIRAWASEPGEYYNAFDGEYGGLWRRNGRAPQVLAGVGFTSQGDHYGAPYRRTPESYSNEWAWVFEGITEKIIGDFGLSGGGAAGFELDRADTMLGTPLNAVTLASSEGHDDSFVLVPEDILTHHDTWPHKPIKDLIRADIVYFETAKGGGVFSVGSITFCGSLPHNNCENNISKMIENVIRKFLSN